MGNDGKALAAAAAAPQCRKRYSIYAGEDYRPPDYRTAEDRRTIETLAGELLYPEIQNLFFYLVGALGTEI